MPVTESVIESRLDRRVMPGDHMHIEANSKHYFSVGASALHCIATTAALSRRNTDFLEVLDFACGSGRVTRWLRAAFPSARVTASDLRADSLAWIAEHLGAEPWLSAEDIGTLQPPRSFDLIWCGSLITHLPEEAATSVLRAFGGWLSPGGLAVVSAHGRRVLENRRAGRQRYVSDDALFARAEAACEAGGFGYVDYPGRRGIGCSVCSPAWLARTIVGIKDVRLVALAEAVWDNHHDIVAFQRARASA